MTVKEMLGMMESDQEVVVNFLMNNGSEYACSLRDGFRTVEDCTMGIEYDLLNKTVDEVRTLTWHDRFSGEDVTSIVIDAYIN